MREKLWGKKAESWQLPEGGKQKRGREQTMAVELGGNGGLQEAVGSRVGSGRVSSGKNSKKTQTLRASMVRILVGSQRRDRKEKENLCF